MKPTLTGSRVYGPARPDSDIDVVVGTKLADELKNLLGDNSIHIDFNPNPSYFGYKFEIGGYIINIIVAETSDEMESWKLATEFLKSIPPIEDRGTRIKTFNRFRKSYLEDK